MYSIFKLLTIIYSSIFFTACASVQPTPAIDSNKISIAAGDDAEKICKRYAVSGSNFKKKVCMTAEEWEENRENAKRGTSDFQRRGSIQKQSGN